MKDFWTIREALTWGTEQLTSPGNASPRNDAEILLALALSRDRVSLYTHPEQAVGEKARQQFISWIEMRKNHYPIQYIRGSQEFFGRDFILNQNTLIPRPETELLVETTLDLCRDFRPESRVIRVLDLGTGSGCVAVTLAAENPRLQIDATDIDPLAVYAARINARRLLERRDRITFFVSDLGNCLAPGYRADLIVSNPPYVGWSEIEKVDPSVILHEPEKAVFSGDTGLECFQRIFSETGSKIKNDGYLLLEIGEGQSAALEKMGGENGWDLIATHPDLSGKIRCLVFSPGRNKIRTSR